MQVENDDAWHIFPCTIRDNCWYGQKKWRKHLQGKLAGTLTYLQTLCPRYTHDPVDPAQYTAIGVMHQTKMCIISTEGLCISFAGAVSLWYDTYVAI